jgi:hypothetical protein
MLHDKRIKRIEEIQIEKILSSFKALKGTKKQPDFVPLLNISSVKSGATPNVVS